MTEKNLTGRRYSAAGRPTGTSRVSLYRGKSGTDIILSVGDRTIHVDAEELRQAVNSLAPATPNEPGA